MRRHKGSFTIEASILAPFVLFMMMSVLKAGLYFYQQSVEREVYQGLKDLDIVSEFYNYQILKELGEEIQDD